jgi:putative flippase GtrA
VDQEGNVSEMIGSMADHEPVRYLGSAIVCVVVSNAVLIAGDLLGLNYAPVLVLSSWLGATVGYVLHTRFTFRAKHSWSSYFQLMGGVALAFPLALALMALLVSILRLPMWIAAPVATVGMLIYNYLNARFAILRRLWVSRA